MRHPTKILSPRLREQIKNLMATGWTDQQIMDRYNMLSENDQVIRAEGVREIRSTFFPRSTSHLLSSERFDGRMAANVNNFLYS